MTDIPTPKTKREYLIAEYAKFEGNKKLLMVLDSFSAADKLEILEKWEATLRKSVENIAASNYPDE